MKRIGGLVLVVALYSCGMVGKQVDPAGMVKEQVEKERVPEVCKGVYENPKPSVSVVSFANNSTFDYVHVVQETARIQMQKQASGGLMVDPRMFMWNAQVMAQFQVEGQKISREINARLPETVEEGVINELVNMKGLRVFTRSDLQKVLQEQKFQLSGLIDDNTAVQVGKLAGVRYIVTGAINNVDLKWTDMSGFSSQMGGNVLIRGGLSTQEGWHVNVTITVRLIDVETGEILLSKQVSGKHIIGKVPYPSYDVLVGGIKMAVGKALQDIRPEYSKHFAPKGYIYEIRRSQDGKERIALVNMGVQDGVKKGTVFYVYTLEEVQDPIKGITKCSLSKLPVVLKATAQVQQEQSWAIIEGEPQHVARVKIGQLVEREPLKGQSIWNKLGY